LGLASRKRREWLRVVVRGEFEFMMEDDIPSDNGISAGSYCHAQRTSGASGNEYLQPGCVGELERHASQTNASNGLE
jgi:hypothetical protein